jgi:hypothetical protein
VTPRAFLGLVTCAAGVLAFGAGLGVSAQSPPAGGAQVPRTERAPASAPTREQLDFFERKVRPILADRCYKCHSAASGSPRSSLALDWRGGWEEGGVRGPAIAAGDPENSLLIEAVRFDGDVRMPPDGKLSTEQVNDLVTWVRMGAPDPRTASPAGTATKYGGNGRNHWAFKPVVQPNPPAVSNSAWVKNDVDRFVLARLEARSMGPNPPADKRTLIRRAYYDVVGLPPTPEQVDAFLADSSPNAFEKVVDGLLASPHYGERWGRHWLDVARYSDTKGQPNRRREEAPFFPYAWTYRDYVIKAFNDDVPYDRFIREQLAADLLDEGRSAKRNPASLAALGFLTLGDHFGGNRHDVINDRIDVTSKAFLGLTVTCARCHDHKFDPIPTADYYSLYGIFASSMEPDEAPVIAPPNAAYAAYLAKRQELDARVRAQVDQHIANLFGDYRRHGGLYLMATTLPENRRARYLARSEANPALVPNWIALLRPNVRAGISIFQVWTAMARVPEERFEEQAPRLLDNLLRGDRPQGGRGRGRAQGPMAEPPPELNPLVRKAFNGRPPVRIDEVADTYGKLLARTDAEWQAAMKDVWEAALFRVLPRPEQNQLRQLRTQSELLELSEPGALARAHILVDAPTPADAPILVRGQAETPGQVVPRRFLEILSGKDRPRVRDGSGRVQLANAIASPNNPLTARVIVNRVWQHHFGRGIVTTPDDLGNQSAPPTHPELLDWLASRFVADGWSLKKLHRQILLSAAWQQSSRNNPRYAEVDPFNELLWRANIRRLEFEPLRDSILAIGGALDRTVGGHPIDLAGGMRPAARGRGGRGNAANQLPPDPRRSVYGFIDRASPDEVLNTFDVATPAMTMGKRYETMVPQQALFLMNSPLVIEQVRTVVNRDAFQNAASDEARIRFLYQLFFQRLPSAEEVQAGRTFVAEFQPSVPGPVGPTPAGRGRRGEFAPAPPADGARGQRGRGRGADAPARRLPLNGWQEYAHALLLTNEAAFVN